MMMKYEKFYEEYGYEPDEQSEEIQEKSSIEINRTNLTIKKWINSIFEKTIDKEYKSEK